MRKTRVTVLVPARMEELSLPTTLPLIALAARAVPFQIEILLITPEGSARPALASMLQADRALVRGITANRRGKVSALRAGVEAAHGDLLVLVDADVVPNPQAFVHVLTPLLDGTAEACAGRLSLARRADAGPTCSMLERWAEMCFDAWHRLRSADAAHCWALSGALYGIRRSFFPSTLLVPAVDDASVGLHVREMGGRFAYAPEAHANVLAPASYRDWVRQKIRTRRGWALLAARRPDLVRTLRKAYSEHLREAIAEDRTAWLLRAQDWWLRQAAFISVRCGLQPGDEWKPARSTKRWGDPDRHLPPSDHVSLSQV